MSSVESSLYESLYTVQTHGTPTQQDIGVTKIIMEKKKASGSATQMPHPWMLTIIEKIYNQFSSRNRWMSREMDSADFPNSYADVVGSKYQVKNIGMILDAIDANHKRLQSVTKQLRERFANPEKFPLPGWPNGFISGFEVADVSIIVLLFFDLTPPDEWVWKATFMSLASALFDPKSPSLDWRNRTGENANFHVDGEHKCPVFLSYKIKDDLLLRFQLRTMRSSPVLEDASTYYAKIWMQKIVKYVQGIYEQNFTGFTKPTADQLEAAFGNVTTAFEEGEVFAYHIRFFLNSFVPPADWNLSSAAHVMEDIQAPHVALTDEDYMRMASDKALSRKKLLMSPMAELFDEVMADEPPDAPPEPLPIVSVTPFDAATMPAPSAMANAYESAAAAAAAAATVATPVKRDRHEIENLKLVSGKDFSTSGAAGALSMLDGVGKYKGSVQYSDGSTNRVNTGLMTFTEGTMALLDGTLYDGGWMGNLWHGHGILKFPGKPGIIPASMPEDTPCVYIGGFENGQFQGYGSLDFLAFGQKWEGYWENGLRTSFTSRMTIPPTALGHWSGQQVIIGIWPQASPEFISLSTYAHERAIRLQTDLPIEGSSSETVVVQLPHYDTKIETPRGGGIALRSCSSAALVAIIEFFSKSNPHWLGWGGDTKDYAKYDTIVPIAMFDIDVSTHIMFHNHKTALGQMGVDRRVKNGKAMIDADPALRDVLDVDTCTRVSKFLETLNYNIFAPYDTDLVVDQNEQYLFHGGPWSAIWSILQTGFDEKRANNGLFGRGCYFAEDPGKCDQYASDRYSRKPMTSTERKHVQDYFGIEDSELADAVVDRHQQDIFCMLMCRVVLGNGIHRSLTEFHSNRTGGVKVQHGKNKGSDEPLFYGDDNKPMEYDVPSSHNHHMSTAHNLNRVFTSIVGKHDIGPGTSNRWRYREFITYKGIIARPTQLIFYKRVNKKIPSSQPWTDDYSCP